MYDNMLKSMDFPPVATIRQVFPLPMLVFLAGGLEKGVEGQGTM